MRGMGGDPGRIRTFDPEIRNLVLYPAELRDQPANIRTLFAHAQMGGSLRPMVFAMGAPLHSLQPNFQHTSNLQHTNNLQNESHCEKSSADEAPFD